jgi:hypothetical protein
MSKSFFLHVRDHVTSNTYTFDAYIEEGDDSFIDLYIGDTNGACIHIVTSEDEEASLADLTQYAAGFIDIMFKGVLKYITQVFPHIRRVSLQDLANETPKRLSVGRPGWYEERYGAKPTVKTQALKGRIKKLQVLSDDHVGLPAPELFAPELFALELLGTTWDLSKSTIEEYHVSIHITNEKALPSQECSWLSDAKRRKRRHSRDLGEIALLTLKNAIHFMCMK